MQRDVKMEAVRTYTQTVDKVLANRGILNLVAEYRRECQQLLAKGEDRYAWLTFGPLVPMYSDLHIALLQGMSLRWEFFVNAFDNRQQINSLLPSSASAGSAAIAGDLTEREGRHAAFVRELASAASVFQDRTESLLEMYRNVESIIDELAKCPYEQGAFAGLLVQIQKIVSFFLRSCSMPMR